MYENNDRVVRKDLKEAHEYAWHRLGMVGTWLNAKTRVGIIEELRYSKDCRLCELSKNSLSPNQVEGKHDSLGILPDGMVEIIHRLRHDAARITEDWVNGVALKRVTDGEYVEIIAVVATVLAIDGFNDTLGWPRPSIPTPQDGIPSKKRPINAKKQLAWVPTLHPRDIAAGEINPYGDVRGVHIHQALSLVPEEVIAFFKLDAAQYLHGTEVRDFTKEYRALTHQQIELLAGRVSAINQCVY
jgi:hypothetical protein